jgi:Catalytic LigB subunit of aromatic ring-opening dioxygenase
MATIIGCVTNSHAPAIGRAIELGLQEEPYLKPFFDRFKPVHRWLAQARPDVVVVIYNDHGLEQTGRQGIELMLWLAARAALGTGGVREVAAAYHLPISDTAAGMMLLEPAS